MARRKKPKAIKTITHPDRRKNLPTSEYQAAMKHDERHPVQVAYERRNRDLDPQLVWRGKDKQDEEPLVAQAPPLYIQEKVHPKALLDSLVRYSKEDGDGGDGTIDLFADFNGVPDGDARTEFYQHDANWANRMILGDSLHVMASLAEREALRGKVQCIYIDPPYGIKFNSNFPVVHDKPRREGREEGAHQPRARAGEGVPRHMARRDPLVSGLPAGPADGGARSADRERVGLRADRRRERAPGACADG